MGVTLRPSVCRQRFVLVTMSTKDKYILRPFRSHHRQCPHPPQPHQSLHHPNLVIMTTMIILRKRKYLSVRGQNLQINMKKCYSHLIQSESYLATKYLNITTDLSSLFLRKPIKAM